MGAQERCVVGWHPLSWSSGVSLLARAVTWVLPVVVCVAAQPQRRLQEKPSRRSNDQLGGDACKASSKLSQWGALAESAYLELDTWLMRCLFLGEIHNSTREAV